MLNARFPIKHYVLQKQHTLSGPGPYIFDISRIRFNSFSHMLYGLCYKSKLCRSAALRPQFTKIVAHVKKELDEKDHHEHNNSTDVPEDADSD